MELTVTDDGRGLPATLPDDTAGISGMRERAALVGATLHHQRRRRNRRALEAAVIPLKTRILLADDHTLVREGLRMVLEAQPDLEVVSEAGDGVEAVQLALKDDVDLAILDVAMPKMTGLQAARELQARRPEVKVLMLSMHDSEQYFFEALKVGASGYVLKSGANRDLVEACRAAMRGQPFLYPRRGHGADPRLPRRPRRRASPRTC